jgi:hypothetical protein
MAALLSCRARNSCGDGIPVHDPSLLAPSPFERKLFAEKYVPIERDWPYFRNNRGNFTPNAAKEAGF